MQIRIGALVAMVMLAGCVFRTVRASDVNSWRGASAVDLQTHRLFSTLPKRVEVLGDNMELWTYSNCAATTTPVVCNPIGNSTVCTGGVSGESCCSNQFWVRRGTVEAYRPLGSCYTDCSIRPGGYCAAAPLATQTVPAPAVAAAPTP